MRSAALEDGLPLAVVGISHRTAPVEVRERVAFDGEGAALALGELREGAGVREAVLLSTCNRTELYLVPADGGRALRAAEGLLARRAGTAPGELGPFLFRARGPSVVRHLFEVTSGLDSLVLGEAEIQGQVREAFEIAAKRAPGGPTAGPVLHRLFEMALAVGGRVRSETRLGEGTASVPSAAVELARKIFGPLAGRRVVVLGAGATAELTARALVREGVRDAVVVVNRTLERGRELAQRVGGRALPLEELPASLAGADVVVASTAARAPVVTPEVLEQAFPRGLGRPLLMVDIAVPRDVAPEVGDFANVFLYNVDDLREIVDDHLRRRLGEVPGARRIILGQEEEFRRWVRAREAGPLIRSLRERAEELRREETERLLRRMGHLLPEDRQRLEAFTRRLVGRLLHEPTLRLREGGEVDREELAVAVRRVLEGAGVGGERESNQGGSGE